MNTRPGTASLAELLLVFWGFALVLAALAEVTRVQGRLARRQLDGLRLQEAVRTATLVVGRETRALIADDMRDLGDGGVAVRAVRGSGPVCAATGASVDVLYAGDRLPDPAKDSVVVVARGGEEVRAVEGASRGACEGRGQTLILDAAPARPPLFVLVFEPGSYHAVDGAVRYRLGRAGRQPLTEALFDDLGLETGSDGRLRLHLTPHPDSVTTGEAHSLVFTFHPLNLPRPAR